VPTRWRFTTSFSTATCPAWRETAARHEVTAPDVPNIDKVLPDGHEGEFCVKLRYDGCSRSIRVPVSFKQWSRPDFRASSMVTIQHGEPYYDGLVPR